jgi:hypothetical protein
MRDIAFPVYMMRAHLHVSPSIHPQVWNLDEKERRIKKESRTS